MSSSLLEVLNPPQRDAVVYFDSPLLVLAGAGSGKTRVLTHKIAHMIQQQTIAAENVLAVTFTNKAAGEMKERIAGLCGSLKFPWMGTFHSICVKILRINGSAMGIPNTYTIYDRDDQISVVKDVLKAQKVDEEDVTPSSVLARISKAKSKLQTPAMFLEQEADLDSEMVGGVYREYQRRVEANGALDFDDLLMKTVQLFTTQPDVLERYRRQFQYTLIDEYQDVNYAQHVLVTLIAKHSGKITAVGDDDQSIYAFRGSDVGLILRFEHDFPGAHVIKLEQNYRSTRSILECSNHLIKHNTERRDKTLWTSNDQGEKPTFRRAFDGMAEARYVVRAMQREHREWRRPWSDFAVLFRTNAQSRAMEEVLVREAIPYTMVGGTRFFERKEIKDVMAYLWVIANPSDEVNLKRIVNTPPRGIGITTLKRLEEAAVRAKQSLFTTLKEASRVGDIGAKALAATREVSQLIEKMQRESETTGVADILKKIIHTTGYDDYLTDGTPEGKARLQNVEELINVAAEFQAKSEEPTLRNFLAEKALSADVDSWDDKAGSVTLMTLHAAKGLEFPVVFLVGLEEDLFPHARCRDNPAEMEEERRLAYVGITRARERLFLTSAQRRRVYGEERERLVSTFVKEIPEELLTIEESEPWEAEETWYAPPPRPVEERRQVTPPPYTGFTSRPTTPTRSTTSTRSTRTPAARTSSPVRTISAPIVNKVGPGRVTRMAEPEAPPPFSSGEAVRHKVFGVGTVQKIDKGAVTVEFPGYGTKTLMANFLMKEGGAPPVPVPAAAEPPSPPAPSPAPQMELDLQPQLQQGDLMHHPQFGNGVLKEVVTNGAEPHLVIMFPDEIRTLPSSEVEKVG
ncbi:MAG: ATP-dependent helicase [Candidatus Xenobia bacterium]